MFVISVNIIFNYHKRVVFESSLTISTTIVSKHVWLNNNNHNRVNRQNTVVANIIDGTRWRFVKIVHRKSTNPTHFLRLYIAFVLVQDNCTCISWCVIIRYLIILFSIFFRNIRHEHRRDIASYYSIANTNFRRLPLDIIVLIK